MSVRNALLGLLAQRPRHGYELHAAFEAVVGESNWDVKPAQIYTTLARLQDAGLVVEESVGQDAGPEKRNYAITSEGRVVLGTWFNSGIALEHQRDEFFVKMVIAVATGEADPRKVIQTQRAKLYQDLHALTAQRNRTDPRTALAQVLLFDKAIMHLEADLRWLDMVDARLEEVKRQPLPEPELKARGRPKKTDDKRMPMTTETLR